MSKSTGTKAGAGSIVTSLTTKTGSRATSGTVRTGTTRRALIRIAIKIIKFTTRSGSSATRAYRVSQAKKSEKIVITEGKKNESPGSRGIRIGIRGLRSGKASRKGSIIIVSDTTMMTLTKGVRKCGER